MDVKFRADLLGKSVLFMGYSFRDINIRLIWFKLNQMMQEIPNADRRQSYIVRLEPNPVLEALYEAVGLKTIVLDAPGDAPTGSERGQFGGASQRPITNLGDFLAELAVAASSNGDRPGTSSPMFASRHLIELADQEIEKYVGASGNAAMFGPQPNWIWRLLNREIPPQFEDRVNQLAIKSLEHVAFPRWRHAEKCMLRALGAGALDQVATFVLKSLANAENSFFLANVRMDALKSDSVPWEVVWEKLAEPKNVEMVATRLAREIDWNEQNNADPDIAFLSDLAKRVVALEIDDPVLHEWQTQLVADLSRVEKIYPSVSEHKPNEGRPQLDALLREVSQRRDALNEAGLADEPPF